MGETLCKISFLGHNILLQKNMVSKLKAFEMICKYYLFFRNFDIDFFAPMVYNKTKGVIRCHSVTFKTTEWRFMKKSVWRWADVFGNDKSFY